MKWFVCTCLSLVPLCAENVLVEPPFQYFDLSASALFWKPIGVSTNYATTWETADSSASRGTNRIVNSEYRLGVKGVVRANMPYMRNALTFTAILYRTDGSAFERAPGFVTVLGESFVGGFARAYTRQNYVSGDLVYNVCFFRGNCLETHVFGGIHYVNMSDQIKISSNVAQQVWKSEFQGGGLRFGLEGVYSMLHGLSLRGDVAFGTPVGRRSCFEQHNLVFDHGKDTSMALEVDGRLAATYSVIYCCIEVRVELSYDLKYYFHALNRRNPLNTGFGQHHGGRGIGFAGPAATIALAF